MADFWISVSSSLTCASVISNFSLWYLSLSSGSIKSISPPQASVYDIEWFTEFDSERFTAILCSVWSGFIPVPVLSGVEFWNTNILNHDDVGGFAKYFILIAALINCDLSFPAFSLWRYPRVSPSRSVLKLIVGCLLNLLGCSFFLLPE